MTRRSDRKRPPRALLLALPLLIASRAPLAEPPATPGTPSSQSTSAERAGALRYRVDIDAPKALRDTLSASVDLVRWQDYADMTESLFDALVAKAIDQAREAAATEGFFSAQVGVDTDRSTSPIAVKLHVTPGTQARVTSANLTVTG